MQTRDGELRGEQKGEDETKRGRKGEKMWGREGKTGPIPSSLLAPSTVIGFVVAPEIHLDRRLAAAPPRLC